MYPKVTGCDIIDQFKLVPNMYSLMTTSCKHGCDFSGFIIPGEFLDSLGDHKQLLSPFLPVAVCVYSRVLMLQLLLYATIYMFQCKL
jgi:hypothetical protein